MFTAKVVGTVWATQKSPGLKGFKLLLVQNMNSITGELSGMPQMAVCDKIDAGMGDVVLIMDEGGSARAILERDNIPVRTLVVGIVDQISIHNEKVRYT